MVESKMMKCISTSLFKIFRIAVCAIPLGVLFFIFLAFDAFALTSSEFYLDENGEIQYYNCPRTVDAGDTVRQCIGNPLDSFETVPSVGSFEKYEAGIVDIADIEYDDEYRFAMDYMVRSGYFKLFRKNLFPSRALTREEFLDILLDVLAVSVPDSTPTDCFADLRLIDRKQTKRTQETRKKKICYAKGKGWLDDNLRFSPTKNITKAAAAKVLMSAYDFPGGFTNLNDNYFDDVGGGTWYARYVNAGRKSNIFPDKRRFEPGALLTRRDASIWFYNLRRAKESPRPEDTVITDIKQFAETKLSQLINESRLEYGEQQLKFDEKLYMLAVAHSQDMAKASSLTHGNLKNYKRFLGKDYIAIGENIAVFKTAGQGDIAPSIERIHLNMMMEPAGEVNHRANILGESFAFTYYAIAVYEDKSNGRIWITEIFAKRTARAK